MSCSVRKKGPKLVSKYSFSLRAWLFGADHRSTGFVVILKNAKPEEHMAMITKENRITGRGFRTQKAPHDVNVTLKTFSNFSPNLSHQVASPAMTQSQISNNLQLHKIFN